MFVEVLLGLSESGLGRPVTVDAPSKRPPVEKSVTVLIGLPLLRWLLSNSQLVLSWLVLQVRGSLSYLGEIATRLLFDHSKVLLLPLAQDAHFNLQMHLNLIDELIDSTLCSALVKMPEQRLLVVLLLIITVPIILEQASQTLGSPLFELLFALFIFSFVALDYIIPLLSDSQQFLVLFSLDLLLLFSQDLESLFLLLLSLYLLLFCLLQGLIVKAVTHLGELFFMLGVPFLIAASA